MLWDQLDPTDQDLLDSVANAPAGPARVAAAETVLTELAARDSFPAEALARMALVEATHYVPDQPGTLTHIAWLRQAVDHPALAGDEQSRHRVHWMLKWAPSLMLALPQISLDEVDAALDDLEQVFRRSGFALRPVLGFRARVAMERGDEDAVRRVMARWVAEPRDELSDCLACDTANQGLVWERVDPARAAEAWRPLFDGSQRCTEEPQHSLAHDALLRLRAGDVHGALGQVRAAWPLARHEPLNNEAVACCLVAWTRMGNLDRALPALLDRLDWLSEINALTDLMTWTGAATLVLDAAVAAGSAPDTVGGMPLAARREEWYRTASDVAQRFDDRNGTTYYTDRLAEWLDLAHVATTPTAPPLAVPTAGAAAPPRPESIAHHADAVRAELESYGPAVEALLTSWVHHRESLLGAAHPEDEAHIAFLDRLAARDSDQPGVLLDRAEQAALAAGLSAQRLRVRAERLSVLGDDVPDRVEQLVRIAEELDGDDAHGDASGVWRTAARHAASPEEAEQLCLRAAASAARSGDHAREGLALVEAAHAAGSRPDRAEEHLARARPLIAQHPRLQLLVDETQARLLAAVGRYDDAVELLAGALASEREPGLAISARFLLCDLLTDLNRLEDLLDASARALSEAAALEDPLALALAQRFHGLALVETGRPAEALELLDAAIPMLSEQMPHLVGPLRWAHANALGALGEPGPARTSFAAAATAFGADERLNEAGHAQLHAGSQAWDMGDLDAAEAHFDAAVGFADATRDPALLVAATRSRAVVRKQGGAVPDLAELDSVLDEARARMRDWEVDEDQIDLVALHAQLLRDGAGLLADSGHFDEAAIRMREAERVWPYEGETWLLRAERGLFLVGAGRFGAAEDLLRAALAEPGAADAPDLRHRLVLRWATALDEGGQTPAAERVWEEFHDPG